VEGNSNVAEQVPVEFEVNNVQSVVEVELDRRGAALRGHCIPIDIKLRSGWGSVNLPGDANPLANIRRGCQAIFAVFPKIWCVGCTIFMNRLRIGFEKSTFVKRLKAASRRQLDVAVALNNMEGFSLKDGEVDTQSDLERLAEREISESKTISTLLQDMAAYTDRHPDENYSRVLAEMQSAVVSSQLRDMAESINANGTGGRYQR